MRSSKIQRDCNNHNNSLRQVKYVYSYSPEKFMSSLAGNLLITGGSSTERRNLLLRAISQQRQNSYEPVVIFSESEHFQADIIDMAERGEIGELFVCSTQYKNYDFFHNMNVNQIIDYFADVASLKGYRDTSELHDFAGAFLNILSAKAPVKLASIHQFSKNSDTSIANLAGTESVDYDMITASSRGGVNFRRLLGGACNAFDSITTPSCNTGFNIGTAINNDCVIFINANSVSYEFLSLYFLQELKSVLNKNFTVVFDDSILLNNSEFLEFINITKQRSNVNVVISQENILSLPGSENLEHFKRQAILLDGNIPPNALQDILTKFGEYSHFEQTTTVGNTPHLFVSLFKSESNNVTPYSRPKILLEEVYGNKAVLNGHNGAEILVVRNF